MEFRLDAGLPRKRMTATVVAAALLAAGLSGSPANAAFFAPVITAGASTSAPWGIVKLLNGTMAVSEEGTNAVALFSSSGSPSTVYPLGCTGGPPTCNKKPHGMAVGPDGKLYVAEQAINNAYANKIAIVDPTCTPSVSTTCVTEQLIPTPSAGPEGIALGADGNIWFTEGATSKIGEIPCVASVCAPASITDFAAQTPASVPFLITAGISPTVPVWFTERIPGAAARLGYVTVTGSTVAPVDFLIATSSTQPFGITLNANLLWFTEQTGHRVGFINPTCASTSCTIADVTEYTLAVNTAPSGIAADANHNLWFAEQTAGGVGEVVPTTVGTPAALHGYQINITTAQPLNIAFNGATGWVTNNGNGTLQTFGETQPSSDPLGMYMAQVYLDTLSRPMEQAGHDYWVQHVVPGGGSQDASATSAFTFSLEYRYDTVNAIYTAYLARSSDGAGLAYWSQQIANGATYEQIKAFILSSNEFYALSGGTDLTYVNNVYQVVLGRPAGAGEQQYWAGRLAAGLGRSAMAYAIITSDEGYAAYITSVYQRFLRHGPGSGVTYWTGALRGGLRDEGFIANVLASAEYYAYAVNH